jgi:F5/8 type C domain
MSRLIASVLLIVSFAVFGAQQAKAAPLPIAEVTASDFQDPNVPAHTLDGDLGTRWSAQGAGQWIRYELEPCDTVALVRIAWYQGDTRVTFFTIETSEDGDSWIPAHIGISSGDTLDLQPVDIDDTAACFVRIVGFGNSVNDWNSITEVQIDGGGLLPPGPLPVLAVSASDFQDPNIPANTLDMDLNTRWSAQGAGQWIEFDLGEGAPTLNRVSIAWYQGVGRSTTFDIEVSTDGVTYTRVYGGYSSGTTVELQPHAFAAVSARYVRIVGFGNSFNDWNSITEVELMHTQ